MIKTVISFIRAFALSLLFAAPMTMVTAPAMAHHYTQQEIDDAEADAMAAWDAYMEAESNYLSYDTTPLIHNAEAMLRQGIDNCQRSAPSDIGMCQDGIIFEYYDTLQAIQDQLEEFQFLMTSALHEYMAAQALYQHMVNHNATNP